MATLQVPDKRKPKIDKHMNHFMVKAAHETANFLAQQPKTPATVKGESSLRNKVDEPSCVAKVHDERSEGSRHNSEELNARQSGPKNSNFDEGKALQIRTALGPGRNDNQGFPSSENPRKDVKDSARSNASTLGAERSRGKMFHNSNSPRGGAQPRRNFEFKN